ncbi:hypothetical protein CPB83DRAFT_907189 [Crepidotus variabilis]|uniref:Uncharacterized protein n=1 Tax=Crepidotus variabilis TaxID=179855 RepID=A0A9P6EFB4_9AGAR|nr:hypothetical protein CPB83DRAFT_907189 [Crepidotus variabilis]
MSASTLGEPFVLSTYVSTTRGKKPQSYIPGAFVCRHKRPERSEEYVTIAVQADGLHVLDVDNIHPVVSNTFGPSCSFFCPPLTLPSISKQKWTTYAVGSLPTDPSSLSDASRTIWTWESDGKTSSQCRGNQTILSDGESIRALHAVDDLRNRILAVSSAGTISILDTDILETKAIFVPKSADAELVDVWVFPRENAKFGDNQRGALVVLLLSEVSSFIKLRILVIDEVNSISQLQEHDLLISAKDVASTTCSNAGILSILETNGLWSSYELSAVRPPEPESSVRLRNFPFYTPQKSTPNQASLSTSTLALTSSHILLASLLSAQQIILQIWDLRFSVLLASHHLAVPSSLSAIGALHLSLVSGTGLQNSSSSTDKTNIQASQAYLVISSVPSPISNTTSKETSGSTADSKTTALVVVIPYATPNVSTVAAAMGRGDLSKRWLSSSSTLPIAATAENDLQLTERRKMLQSLKMALEGGRTQAAEATFMKWVPTDVDDNLASNNASMDYNFVKELLELLLVPSNDVPRTPSLGSESKGVAYSSEIVRYLLERRVVSSLMLVSYGGLLGVLRTKGDWVSDSFGLAMSRYNQSLQRAIELAFTRVLDLTEMEIVETLGIILVNQRGSFQRSLDTYDATEHSDAMQIDLSGVLSATFPTDKITPLARYLTLVASYPTSTLPLLLALRRHLQDPEDVSVILQILSDWLSRRTQLEMEIGNSRTLMPGKKDTKRTEEGVWVVVKRKGQTIKDQGGQVPGLEKLTSLIQIILDSSFLSIISHKPSHQVLIKLATQLSPEINFVQAMQSLLGSLEPFSAAQQKAISNSLSPKSEKDKSNRKQDLRLRGNRTGKGSGAEIGLYSLEELSL